MDPVTTKEREPPTPHRVMDKQGFLFPKHRHPSEWSLDEKVEWAREQIDALREDYTLHGHFVGFSGGGDSIITAHLVMSYLEQQGLDVPVGIFHANTGIGLPETHRFIKGVCLQEGWDLHEVRAKEDCGEDYWEICEELNFPGNPLHYIFKDRLKMRAVRELRYRTVGKRTSKKIALYTGIRWDESDKRRGYTTSIVDEPERHIVFLNPIYWFSDADKREYRKRHGVFYENPASALMGMSGECYCGANADALERAALRKHFPLFEYELSQREKGVQACHPDEQVCWHEAPERSKEGAEKDPGLFPLCHGCGK